MVRYLIRALILALVVGAGLYITLTNNEHVTLRLPPSFEVQSNAGVLYLSVFFAGFLVASIIGVLVGLKSHLRERRLRNFERQRQHFASLLLTARSKLALGDWESAKNLWKDIIKRDPDNIVARVELSKALSGEGDKEEALRVLDATRAALRSNAEVLLGAAELNASQGNNTAALDNAVLLLHQHPSKKSALLATELAEQLERYDDAIEYLDALEKLGDSREDLRDRLLFKRLLHQHSSDHQALREALTFFVKKHPACVEALEYLAKLESGAGHVNIAADLLIRRAKITKASKDWESVSKLWLNSSLDVTQRAEKSIAAARSAVNDTSGNERLIAQLKLTHLLISLNRLDEAKHALDNLPEFARKEALRIEGAIKREYLLLKGLSLFRSGLSREACEVWAQLVESEDSFLNSAQGQRATPRDEPSPVYSTP